MGLTSLLPIGGPLEGAGMVDAGKGLTAGRR